MRSVHGTHHVCSCTCGKGVPLHTFERRRFLQIKNNLLMDLIAGVSIGFMVVPQGMSYALLAGVPPVWGLYGAFVPVFMYALLGSSRHLAVGPVAVTSLLLGTSLHRIVPAADKIEDASEIPAGLEDVQEQYNTAALQVRARCTKLYVAMTLGLVVVAVAVNVKKLRCECQICSCAWRLHTQICALLLACWRCTVARMLALHCCSHARVVCL